MKQTYGFTLIELLVSITIISILTGIAVPQYATYRKKAFDAAALTDLRSTALAEESYFIDNDAYLACANGACLSLPGLVAFSRGVSMEVTTTEEAFIARASHSRGTGKVFVWDSISGGMQE